MPPPGPRATAPGRHGPGTDLETSWQPARAAAVALLIAVVLVGLRGEVPALGRSGPLRQHPLLIGVILEAVLAALLIAVQIRNRRPQPGAWLATRLRGGLNLLLGAGLVAVPVALLVTHLPPPRPHPIRPRPQPTLPGHPGGRPPHGPPTGSAAPASLIFTVLALLVLAAAVVVVLIAARRRIRYAAVPVQVIDEIDDGEQLREAVESGEAALRELGDARAAIVACYVAMERELAGAGTARAAADTPDELLGRAAGAGLIRGGAAARLTALFYAARFSSHPVPQSSREQARQALREMAADLASGPRPPVQQAGAAPGAGP
jgi:Domain of unknown function (DUF4129)